MEIVTRTEKPRARRRKWALVGVISLTLVVMIVQLIPVKKVKDNPFIRTEESPLIIAHRGGAGIAPENTISAFELSEKLGVDILEFDVRLSKDGEVVVFHDERVDRTTNGKGRISEYTLKELQSFDAGYDFVGSEGDFPFRGKGVNIPSIADVLNQFGHMPMVIELKENDELLADQVSEMLNRFNLKDNVLIVSFYDEISNYFYEKNNGEIGMSTPSNISRNFILLHKFFLGNLYPLKEKALQLPTQSGVLDLTTKRLIADAHERNIAVHYWTINDIEMMKYVFEQGADGIMTDYPNKALHLLQQKGEN
ncbi:glycerophosphodiester phosphodiesterase [Bacillus sp. 2205SS5-2]|uniref:glycerophosphodiester phosphodiesterase n=1 Tax=Bacillus sp. 2205SS5-2 TaxID=3109031 RepID=UPI0030061960